MLDLDSLRLRTQQGEQFSSDEVADIIKELEHFRRATAYLADCHAATLEGLPKATPKTTRERFINICEKAKNLCAGSWNMMITCNGHDMLFSAITRCSNGIASATKDKAKNADCGNAR